MAPSTSPALSRVDSEHASMGHGGISSFSLSSVDLVRPLVAEHALYHSYYLPLDVVLRYRDDSACSISEIEASRNTSPVL
jgi:hypothetical protein